MKQLYRVLVAVNLSLGLILWFLFSTDYSLKGTIPDIVFPPLVMVVGLISYSILKRKRESFNFPIALPFLPSIWGGCLPTLLGIILFIPPFTMGGLFLLDEINNETMIQEVVSPDGQQTARVFFRGVGAYTSGLGRVFVRVTNNRVPIVEKDVFYLGNSFTSDETYNNYVHWQDNQTLYISETDEKVKVRYLQLQIPDPLAKIVRLVVLLIKEAT